MNSQPNIKADRAHRDLLLAKEMVYDNCGYTLSDFVAEPQSAEYSACGFKLNTLEIKFRNGKITPAKIGQFVTLWKRKGNGPIEPFDVSDPIDFVLINTRKGNDFGQFVFPKHILNEKGIVCGNKKQGKRGFRVYPPWDAPDNKQAKDTQWWQLKYFFKISNENIDFDQVKKLFLKIN